MPMDPRYELIRIMYDAGHIKKVSDIFKYIPKTRVAKDAGMNLNQMNARLTSPNKWILRQLFRMGELCGLTHREMIDLVCGELKTP